MNHYTNSMMYSGLFGIKVPKQRDVACLLDTGISYTDDCFTYKNKTSRETTQARWDARKEKRALEALLDKGSVAKKGGRL